MVRVNVVMAIKTTKEMLIKEVDTGYIQIHVERKNGNAVCNKMQVFMQKVVNRYNNPTTKDKFLITLLLLFD